ncbi:MAG: hypothetical protein HC890_17430 [Chloroflexaceae bacterium]|nr:hypothetical protein [Chloroflexaceae bacterium]
MRFPKPPGAIASPAVKFNFGDRLSDLNDDVPDFSSDVSDFSDRPLDLLVS